MGVGSCEFESHLGHLKGDKYIYPLFFFVVYLFIFTFTSFVLFGRKFLNERWILT